MKVGGSDSSGGTASLKVGSWRCTTAASYSASDVGRSRCILRRKSTTSSDSDDHESGWPSISYVAAVAASLSPSSLLLRIAADQGTKTASLRWLSVFPEEDEVALPPLCFLHPTGRWQAVTVTLDAETDAPQEARKNKESVTHEVRYTVVEVAPTPLEF